MILDSHRMGRDMIAAIGSGERKASCLGTISPMTSEMKVVRKITTAKPIVCAVFGSMPSSCTLSAVGSPSVAPEKAPAKIAIKVIPLCTVERKRPGSAARSSAHCAPLLPLRAIAFRRASREDTIASSLIARTPLRPISARRRRTSSQGMGSK